MKPHNDFCYLEKDSIMFWCSPHVRVRYDIIIMENDVMISAGYNCLM